MTGPAIPPEETTEGNVTEIDLENRHLLIEDRAGTPFMKLFWHKAQEEFDGKPTALFNQIRKLKPGYYVAPVIEGVESSISGKIKEAYLKGLPYKERPADFPRSQQKKGGFGGRPYTPRNERVIVLQCCMKVAADVWIGGSDRTLKYEEVMAKITAEAIKAAGELCRAGGVT